MMFTRTWNGGKRLVAISSFSFLLLAGTSGCQVDVGGQTLPSPYYLEDDVLIVLLSNGRRDLHQLERLIAEKLFPPVTSR